jgi:copper(I)-binding protein
MNSVKQKHQILQVAILVGGIALAFSVAAQDAQVGKIKIEGAYTRTTVPGQKVAGGFMKIIDQGAADQLISASSPVADEVQLHTMSMEGNTMQMRQVKVIDVPAAGTVELKPGGLHLMLIGIKTPLKAGDLISVKLKFAKAGEVEVKLPVQPMGHKGAH